MAWTNLIILHDSSFDEFRLLGQCLGYTPFFVSAAVDLLHHVAEDGDGSQSSEKVLMMMKPNFSRHVALILFRVRIDHSLQRYEFCNIKRGILKHKALGQETVVNMRDKRPTNDETHCKRCVQVGVIGLSDLYEEMSLLTCGDTSNIGSVPLQ